MIERLRVQILSHPKHWMEMGSNPSQDQFLHPILVYCRKNKKNTGSQIEHTKKIKDSLNP
jgi:hypothetical protein